MLPVHLLTKTKLNFNLKRTPLKKKVLKKKSTKVLRGNKLMYLVLEPHRLSFINSLSQIHTSLDLSHCNGKNYFSFMFIKNHSLLLSPTSKGQFFSFLLIFCYGLSYRFKHFSKPVEKGFSTSGYCLNSNPQYQWIMVVTVTN